MQIFPRSSNAIARASLLGPVIIVAALFWVMAALQRSPYITYAGVRKPQPVPFSHQHHVTGLGIDCHRAPEKFLRPREQVFNMRYQQPTAWLPVQVDGVSYTDQDSLGSALVKKYQLRTVQDITSCNTCHR